MRLTDPGQLSALLHIPFSDQQLAAITAPLEPSVIIAGAGSGKTTVMAARVVWLVGSGAVRADQVLGLTFTRKAAGELGTRVRRALGAAGLLDEEGQLPGADRVLLVDSVAAIAGGAASASSATTYIESAAGVGDGARTGLASVVTGLLFVGALFLTPLVSVVPFEAASPALVVVGFGAWWVLRPKGPGVPEAAMRPVGGLSIGVVNAPQAPQVGSNRMRLRAARGGQPVTDLTIDAVVFMPAMGAMPYMESRPRFRAIRPGLYEGEYSLAMGGSWDVDLRVKSGAGELPFE